jgi:hypothetical protein
MTHPPARPTFFLRLSVLFLVIALIGFSTTFFIPLGRGTFRAPPIIYLHGVVVFGWLLFFIAQSSLIAGRKVKLHRQLGWGGAALAAGVVVTGVLVGLHATRRDIAAGGGDFAVGQFVNILIEMLLFGGYVAAAILLRRDGASHKRLLVLATISALAPAWLRFRHLLPAVPDPFITFSLIADSLVLLLLLHDRRTLRRIHPVTCWAGGAMVAVHIVELLAITSGPWLAVSRWLLGSPPT